MGTNKAKNLLTTAEIRRKAEELLQVKTVKRPLPRTGEETQRLVHELEVHQIELELQNAELCQARDEMAMMLDKYTDLFDFAPIGYFTLRRDGAISAVNLAGASLLGIERIRLLGKRFGLFTTKEYRTAFADFLEKVFISSAKETCELLLLKEGTPPLFVLIEGLVSASGEDCRIALIDITQRKQLEEQYLHLASFPKLNPNPVLEVNASGKVAYSNPATYTILNKLGIAEEEVNIFVPSDMNDILGNWDKNDDLIHYREIAIKDRYFLETIYLAPQLDVARIYANDITERKQVEEALVQSEQQFRTLADAIPQLSWMANADGGIFWYNQRWYDFTGTTPEQMYGWGWQSVHDPEVLPQVLEQWKASIATEKPFEMVFPLRGSDGVFRTFLTRGMPVSDQDGKIVRWFGTNTDISEQKRVENVLAGKKLKLEELNKTLEERIRQGVDEMRIKDQAMIQQNSRAALGEMINNIAHQWRQPLNLVALIIQSVQLRFESGTLTSEEMNSDIQDVMENIMHMSQTIEDFRNFFKQDKVKQEFLISEAVKRAISLVSASLEYHNIKVEIKIEDDATVFGYKNEYSQVLLNLFSNTCDACTDRTASNCRIFIRIARENECSVLYFRDNCGGIPDDVISKIFEPYFTTRDPDKGTGIGLYMSKMIIEKNMGGHLTSRNVDGGAEFRVEV